MTPFFVDIMIDALHLLIQHYGGLLIPGIVAYFLTKQTYPFFLNVWHRNGRSEPCLGCVIVCYLGNLVVLTLLLIWLLLAFPQLRPPS